MLKDPLQTALIEAAQRWQARARTPIESDEIERLCARAAREIRSGAYRFSPARRVVVLLDKPRPLVKWVPADEIVQRLLGGILAREIEAGCSEQLWSFRKGRSNWDALSAIQGYLRRYRSATPLKERRLFVFRGDVRRFGERIPVGKTSPIWGMLSRRVKDTAPLERGVFMELMAQCLRPVILDEKGEPSYCTILGTPTGSAVEPALLNLYLESVDQFLGGIGGGCYARFGDDVFFAHPDRSVLEGAVGKAAALLSGLGLEWHPEKSRTFEWSGSGHGGTQAVEYLGMRLDFHGRLGLNSEKKRELIRDYRRAVAGTARLLGGKAPLAHWIRSLEQVCTLDGGLVLPHLEVLLRKGTDRGQLRELEYQFALRLAEQVSGIRGPRAFRHVSWQSLRQEWSFPALVRQKDRGRRED